MVQDKIPPHTQIRGGEDTAKHLGDEEGRQSGEPVNNMQDEDPADMLVIPDYHTGG